MKASGLVSGSDPHRLSGSTRAEGAARLRAALLAGISLAALPLLALPAFIPMAVQASPAAGPAADRAGQPLEIAISRPQDAVRVAATGLTLENARPLAVPPPPGIKMPPAPGKPQRLTLPKPLTAPPAPDLTNAFPTAPAQPPSPEGAPPIPPPKAAEPAPVPAPAPEVAALPPVTPAAPPAETAAPETAALPPLGNQTVRFAGRDSNLSAEDEAIIATIAERMRAVAGMRLQLRSYASGSQEESREARQLSLARALAVRDRLSALGVRSTRVDVRAMGIDAQAIDPSAADRIDIEPQNE